jgi:hypothetical protein
MNVIQKRFDIAPEFSKVSFDLTDEEVIKVIRDNFKEDFDLVSEGIFIPKANIVVCIYDNGVKSRIIYVNKEVADLENLGDISLDNIEDFEIGKTVVKEMRSEDYPSIAGMIKTLVQIKLNIEQEVSRSTKAE